MFRKSVIFFICFCLLQYTFSPTFADTDHWSKPLSDQLRAEGIISETDTLALGKAITQTQFTTLINRFNLSSTSAVASSTETISRLDALKLIIDQLGYQYLANQLKDNAVIFTDVTSDRGYIQLGIDFGIINVNANNLFRPNDALLTEEAIAMLYHVDRLMTLKLDHLSSYYAISSYSQIGFMDDTDSITFGWSRLDYNTTTGSVFLNTTSSNSNEYRMPSGYLEPIQKAQADVESRILMVTTQDTSVDDESFTEEIINDPTLRLQALTAIREELQKDAESMQFTGVLVDFEGLKGETNAKALTAFVSMLRNTLGQDYTISVAVHPVRKAGLVYYDGYDYKGLGDVADRIILMAHDYYPKKLTASEMASGITLTPPTPIQDIYYALKGITDPVTGVQDPSKIVLQLSMDSVQWKLQDGKIINEKPYRPNYAAILARINSGIIPQYSSELKSSFIIFQDDTDGTRNVVWYEDARSVDAKIEMALRMGIKNISVWRLGNIPSYDTAGAYLNVWDSILEYLPDPVETTTVE